MKRFLLSLHILLGTALLAQDGYEIKVTFKPFKKQYIYLGHYFGKTYPIIDSVMLDDKSEAVFRGTKKLNGGIYLIGYPGRNGFFEILVDKQQHFSVIADTATLATGAKFINSADNVLFTAYQQHMQASGKKIKALQEKLKTAGNTKDSAVIATELEKEDKAVMAYREEVIKKNEGSLLSTLLIAMREPILTGKLKDPKNKADSLEAYQFYKSNYWNGVNFWDGRLAYTPFFEDKVDKYYTQLVQPQPDSVIKEIDYMLGFASINEEMNRFLLIKFVNRYLNQKYMWEDAIFVHLFEKYFSNKEYAWLNEKGKKTITDRAYSLMANIMGSPASDIELPDTAGKTTSLYGLNAAYTVLVFWDPTCGHCKEVLPKVDSFYQAKWKAAGIKVFSVAKETDGTKKDWLDFIKNNQLQEWTHVYYSKADEKLRIDNNIPGYSQLYDILSFPTLYLLDKEKRIVAKKLTYQQIDDIWQLKVKGQ
jgi:thiol-disulfide isomerase/thioredoxin